MSGTPREKTYPRRRDGQSKQRKMFSIRMPVDLKGKLNHAAKDNGRSLTDEVIGRLEWSLDADTEEQKLSDALGGPESYTAFQIVALAIEHIEWNASLKWWQCPWTRDQAVKAASRIWLSLGRSGRLQPPDGLQPVFARRLESDPDLLAETAANTALISVESSLHNAAEIRTDGGRRDRISLKAAERIRALNAQADSAAARLLNFDTRWEKEE